MEAKDIDALLHKTQEYQEENRHLEELNNYIKRFDMLIPAIDLTKKALKETQIPHLVHGAMLDSLHKDLKDIQSKVGQLENEITFKSEVYNQLKNICLSLRIDEDSLHALETGNFDEHDDLVKMENSLNFLGSFKQDEYQLKIVIEKAAKIREIERKLLKRFVVFVSKLFIKSESKGELKVHRQFYEEISKYKFIYQFSRKHEDYYRIICDSYIKKSKSLYTDEFQQHINRITELILDNQSLSFCIDSLIRTYQSLAECEINFLKLMDIDSDVAEIFNQVDVMILEFLDFFFQKSGFCVLISIYQFCNEEYKGRLYSLFNTLLEKYKTLEILYFDKMKENALDFEHAVSMNLLLSDDSYSRLLTRFSKIFYDKLCSKNQYIYLDQSIKNLQIRLAVEDDEQKKSVEFESDPKEIKSIFKLINPKKLGHDETRAAIEKLLLEHCPTEKRNDLMKIFSSNK